MDVRSCAQRAPLGEESCENGNVELGTELDRGIVGHGDSLRPFPDADRLYRLLFAVSCQAGDCLSSSASPLVEANEPAGPAPGPRPGADYVGLKVEVHSEVSLAIGCSAPLQALSLSFG